MQLFASITAAASATVAIAVALVFCDAIVIATIHGRSSDCCCSFSLVIQRSKYGYQMQQRKYVK